VPEAFGDRFQARPFRLLVERIVRVGPVDDLPDQDQRRIRREIVLLEDGLERALFPMMPQLHSGDIEGGRPKAICFRRYLLGGDEDKLSLRIDKLPNQPGASDAVDLDMGAGDPFHERPPGGSSFLEASGKLLSRSKSFGTSLRRPARAGATELGLLTTRCSGRRAPGRA
jgi:hypothetical protein